MTVKAIPEGYHTLTAYLIVDGAAQAIDFYKKAFGAEERMRLLGPNGCVAHAELQIGDSCVMLADEAPQMGARSPKHYGGTPVGLMIYVANSDATFKQAVAAGAKVKKPVETQFYGDRNGTVDDPFGHQWTISTHVEDVSPEEMDKRMAAMMAKKS